MPKRLRRHFIQDRRRLGLLSRLAFKGAVEYAEVPGSAGYLGVLAKHAALVTALASGSAPRRWSPAR